MLCEINSIYVSEIYENNNIKSQKEGIQVQAYLKDTACSIPDHHNKENIT